MWARPSIGIAEESQVWFECVSGQLPIVEVEIGAVEVVAPLEREVVDADDQVFARTAARERQRQSQHAQPSALAPR